MEKSKVNKKSKSEKEKERKRSLDRLYAKKPLLEFVVAVLTVPSLILVLILNYNTIKNLNAAKATPTPVSASNATNTGNGSTASAPNFFTEPVTRTPKPTSSSVSQTPCNKSLGPVNITSPNEGDTISSNPVEVDISYDDSTYCSAVWSYSVNGSSWSPYGDNSVALYNLPNGPVSFQLQVRSLTSSDQTTLTRNFIYNGQSTAPAPTSASSSAQ
jgi:hypothetical protein